MRPMLTTCFAAAMLSLTAIPSLAAPASPLVHQKATPLFQLAQGGYYGGGYYCHRYQVCEGYGYYRHCHWECR